MRSCTRRSAPLGPPHRPLLGGALVPDGGAPAGRDVVHRRLSSGSGSNRPGSGRMRVPMTSYTQTVSRRLPRGWTPPRSTVRLLARLLRRLPGRARRRRPRHRNRVLERVQRDPDRAVDGHPVRADAAAGRRLLDAADQGDDVHLLALAVRRRRLDPALGLLPAPRPLRGLPQLAHRSPTSSG